MLQYLKSLINMQMGEVKVSMSLVSDTTTSPYTLTHADDLGAVLVAQDGHTVVAPWSSIYVIIPQA